MHSLQNYAKRKELNYMFLDGDDKVIEDYRTGGAAPYFFILDKERIIRKVIRGYGMGKTDKEITEAIEELLITGMRMEQKVKTFADTFVPSSFIYIQHSDGCQNWKNFLALL